MWGRSSLVPLATAFFLLGGVGLFSATASAQNTQQDRMKTCNTQAADKHLAGDMRKSFMSDCLAGKTAAEPKMTPQQQKMKDCNATAGTKNLAGAARKTFMASCLKK